MRISGYRLKEKTQDRLAEFFVGGANGAGAAALARAPARRRYFFHRLRQIIAKRLEDSLPVEGLIEIDESYGRRQAPSLQAPSRSKSLTIRGCAQRAHCRTRWRPMRLPA
jgi:hypothetical protein